MYAIVSPPNRRALMFDRPGPAIWTWFCHERCDRQAVGSGTGVPIPGTSVIPCAFPSMNLLIDQSLA